MIYHIHSLEELDTLAAEVVANILENKGETTLINLSGDLGVGKTAFVKSCARVLGIQNNITSPTFVIQKEYDLNTDGYTKMIHIDAYRLENKEDLFVLGWQEILDAPGNIIFLEWPEQVTDLPQARHTLTLTFHLERDTSRTIEVKKETPGVVK